jgi:hypothetical protein
VFRVSGIVLATALFASSPVLAAEFVRDDCRSLVQPSSGLRYDSAEHARWYKRFWTGTCEDLKFCFSGSPNWNDIVGKLLVKGGPSERAALLPKACRLGQLIGLDWSREKKIKHIHTADLKVFNTMLEASGDPLRGVEQVEAKAKAMVTPR